MCLRGAGVMGLHIGSDLLIALSYFVIPLALRFFVQRRDIEFSWIFLLFGAFILGCGCTHLLSIWTLWHPIYRFEALVKAVTAAVSVLTALCLVRLMPQLLALPSPAYLQAQIAERAEAEAEITRLNADLERRVAERTAALTEANRSLLQSREALRASNERLEMAMAAGSIGAWEFEPQTSKIILDERSLAVVGVNPQTAFDDRMFFETVVAEDRERVEQAIRAAVNCEQPCKYDVEYRIVRPSDGTLRHLHSRGQAFFSGDARPELTRFVGTVVDITARKQVEEALLQANSDLRQFAYAAAHDLQEPLRNISVSVELLNLTWSNRWDDDARELVQQSVEGSQRVHRMIKDLLNYIRAVEDYEPVQTPTESQDALKDALANLSNKIAETQAQITYDSLPDLRVSRIHLLQLFQNIVGNAIKYRRPEVKPEIKIRAERAADKWTFEIADNGLGFEPVYAERIFGIFKRLHGRDEYGGNGMGLAICARIVSHYGGRIWAEGKPGEGAVFLFTLPA